MKAFYKTGQSQPTIIYPVGTMVERPDDDGFIESDVIKEEYVEAYDIDFSSDPPGIARKPNADQIIADLLKPSAEEVKSTELQLALDIIAEDKLASLRWDASKQYHVDDIVIHDGKKWKATSNNSNNEPDNVPGDWEEVV